MDLEKTKGTYKGLKKIILIQMWIDTGHPILMAHTDFIREGIYMGAGIHQTEIQY